MVLIADSFARAGDMELYNFSTGEGGGPTAGGNKSLRSAANFFRDTSEGNVFYYNWNTSVAPANLMEGLWEPPTNYYGYDAWLARPNVFWQDPTFKTTYLTPGPKNRGSATVVREPDFSWMGPGWAYPGQLFMFGQMEGRVWPYPGGTVIVPAEPTSLKVSPTEQ
jgi:hypothetical protein